MVEMLNFREDGKQMKYDGNNLEDAIPRESFSLERNGISNGSAGVVPTF